MRYYVSSAARRSGDGSADAPFQTISEAAALAAAGDEVIVSPGVYRESVHPRLGGDSDRNRVTYRSKVKGGAVITGAEPVKNWTKHEGDVWLARVPDSFFGSYNPYTTPVHGDWYFATTPVHTGQVYLNGKAMYESPDLAGVLAPEPDRRSWDPEFTVYRWYTRQEDGDTLIFANFHGSDPNVENVEINVRRECFAPEVTGINYITVSGFKIQCAATQWAPPTAYQEGMIAPHWSKGWIIEDCEICDSRCSGISLGKYLQPNNENKWTERRLKHGTQTERDAICQAVNDGWTYENIGHHIIRRCNIHHCGQTGIVGHMGGAFSIIEDNHIHHINNQQDLAGAEIGGIKLHAAIDVIIRRNHIHHCTRGVWLDWQAQGSRLSQNLFHDNCPPVGTILDNPLQLGEDIFIEVSHGPTLIDNNILLSPFAARLSTQGFAFVHNLIAGSFTYVGMGVDNNGVKFPTPRYTPYHVPHRTEIAGFMTILHGDARFYNNIFIQRSVREDIAAYAKMCRENGYTEFAAAPNLVCGTVPYDGYPTWEEYVEKFKTQMDGDVYYDHLPVYTGGNVFLDGAKPCDTEKNYAVDDTRTMTIIFKERDDGYVLDTNIFENLPAMRTDLISTETLGEAFEPEQRFENPDGTSIIFDRDYFGNKRSINPMPGPFATVHDAKRRLF